jgi:hypothetical protein
MKTPMLMRRAAARLATAGLLLRIAATPARGEGLELCWISVDTRSAARGDAFSIVGTAGAADFARMTGGDFDLQEGSRFAMVTVRESLGIALRDGVPVAFWSLLAADWKLEATTVLNAEKWTAVSPTQWKTNGYQLIYRAPPASTLSYFRLAKP